MNAYKKGIAALLAAILLAVLAPAAFAADGDKIPVLLIRKDGAPLPFAEELREEYGLEEEDLEYIPGVGDTVKAQLTPAALRKIAGDGSLRVNFDLSAVSPKENAVPIPTPLFGFVRFHGEYSLFSAADSRIALRDGKYVLQNHMLTALSTGRAATYLQKRIRGEYVTVDVWETPPPEQVHTGTQRDYANGDAAVDAKGMYHYIYRNSSELPLPVKEGEDFRCLTVFELGSFNHRDAIWVYSYPDGRRTDRDDSRPEPAETGGDRRWAELAFFRPVNQYIQEHGPGVRLPKKSALAEKYGFDAGNLFVAREYMDYYAYLTDEQIRALAQNEYVSIDFGVPAGDSSQTFVSGDIFGFCFRYDTGDDSSVGGRYACVDCAAEMRDGKLAYTAELLTLEKRARAVSLLQKKENGKYVTVDAREKTAEALDKAWSETDIASGEATYDPATKEFLQNLYLTDESAFALPGGGDYRVKTVFQYGGRIVAADAYPDGRTTLSGDVYGEGNITSWGARTALKYAARLITPDPLEDPFPSDASDFDGDGRVTSSDARAILRLAAKLIDTAAPARTAETLCEHNYIETVTPPSCTEDGYIVCECRYCGDRVIRTADECDRWSDWYEILSGSTYRFDSGKNVNRSNINTLYKQFFADFLRQTTDMDDSAIYREDPYTRPLELNDMTVCFNDIRERKISYELELTDESDGEYHYKIRFNDFDLHATGHSPTEQYRNVRRNGAGQVVYQEIVTFCRVCGEELGVRIDDTVYDEETEAALTPENGQR